MSKSNKLSGFLKIRPMFLAGEFALSSMKGPTFEVSSRWKMKLKITWSEGFTENFCSPLCKCTDNVLNYQSTRVLIFN